MTFSGPNGQYTAPSFLQGTLTYTPRAVIFDLNGSLGGELSGRKGHIAALTGSTDPVQRHVRLAKPNSAQLRKRALTECDNASRT